MSAADIIRELGALPLEEQLKGCTVDDPILEVTPPTDHSQEDWDA